MMMFITLPAADTLDAYAAQIGKYAVLGELPTDGGVYEGTKGRGEKIDFGHVYRTQDGCALAVEMEPWEAKFITRMLLVRGSKIASEDHTIAFPDLRTPYDIGIGTLADSVRATHGMPPSVDRLSTPYGDARIRLMIEYDPRGEVLLYPCRNSQNSSFMLEIYTLHGVVEAILVY